jgi:hypothetical protein
MSGSIHAVSPIQYRFLRGARIFCVAVFTAVMVAVPVGAQDDAKRSTPADRKDIAITIYNSDLGLVKDVRRLVVDRGILNLNFEGVASRIDPTSVHIRSLDDADALEVLEQNFEYDLISPEKLMEKYLGRQVELVDLIDNKEVRKDARLMGNQGGYVYEMDGKIAINPRGRVVLPDLPEGLISKPTLVWMLRNERDSHTVEASYLTTGISWRSNYVVVLSKDDDKADLSGWVTINNQSGATYADAAVKLVAGDVNRVRQPKANMAVYKLEAKAGRASQFEEQAFFEYHLYTLQRRSTIKDKQTKQISLLDAAGASVTKSYVYQSRFSYWFRAAHDPDKSTKVGVYISLENSEQNHMGMPLPKGTVRVYKKDADAALQFIGEDAIDHTPTDETVRVKLGDAFDIVGERRQTNYKVLDSGHLYESSYSIELRNHKEEDVIVSVVELIPGDWEITQKSHAFEKETSSRVRFDIPVARKATAELTYTIRVRY